MSSLRCPSQDELAQFVTGNLSGPVFETIALGFGSNTIWIDPEHDLVVVWRWHRGTGNEFFRRLIAAVAAGKR